MTSCHSISSEQLGSERVGVSVFLEIGLATADNGEKPLVFLGKGEGLENS